MQLTLHYSPLACSLVPYVALAEAGAEFDVRVVNFLKGEHITPDYLALNPKHKVPVLVVGDEPITENVAILQWIADHFESARLLPTGQARYQAISLMSWCASGIHPTLTPNVLPQKYCDLPGSEDAVKACARKVMHENFAIAEKMLDGRDWFFDHLTIPDIYFYWCFRRARQFEIDLSMYQHCNAHTHRLLERPSVAKLLSFEKEALVILSKG
jgi:glutathione S-transferase